MKGMKLYIDRDVDKTHGVTLNIGCDSTGVSAGMQWRGYDPRDDGEDPWMLYLSFGRWFTKGGIHFYRGKTLPLIKPMMEIAAQKRLSLAMHGRSYWCDASGEKDSVWRYRQWLRNAKRRMA